MLVLTSSSVTEDVVVEVVGMVVAVREAG